MIIFRSTFRLGLRKMDEKQRKDLRSARLSQHNGDALILANNVKRVFTDTDSDHGNCAIGFL
jgi:hypothetical protein